MRARAPGKIVLSGAYAVLDGARAIVAAVDRYAVADTERPASFVSDEVLAALGDPSRAPFVDASALRAHDRKLGLGSSAAILVASLAALELEREPELAGPALVERVLEPALSAHARAQGGGSGIDVAASAHGGVIVARRIAAGLEVRPARLPEGVCVRVLAADVSASTSDFVRRVKAFAAREPALHARLLTAQAEASERAADALFRNDRAGFVSALREQSYALGELGRAAAVPIVTPELEASRQAAALDGAVVLPAGAGGGDIALWVKLGSTDQAHAGRGFELLEVSLGAPGVGKVG